MFDLRCLGRSAGEFHHVRVSGGRRHAEVVSDKEGAVNPVVSRWICAEVGWLIQPVMDRQLDFD